MRENGGELERKADNERVRKREGQGESENDRGRGEKENERLVMCYGKTKERLEIDRKKKERKMRKSSD